jgi:hypothetical protein
MSARPAETIIDRMWGRLTGRSGLDRFQAALRAGPTVFTRGFLPCGGLGHDPEWTKQVLDGFKIRTQPDRWPDGKFIHPHDACFDKDGNIFIAEWVQPGRVSFLRPVS